MSTLAEGIEIEMASRFRRSRYRRPHYAPIDVTHRLARAISWYAGTHCPPMAL